jgi:hypothetical protein
VATEAAIFALCCETPLKVMFGNSGPRTPKSARFRRRRRPDSVRRCGFARTVFSAHWVAGRVWQHVRFCSAQQPLRARAELIIRELKDACALGKIPTKDFPANEALFQVVLLAYNLLNWFKRLCVSAHLRRATLQRLRQRLFLVPSQLARPGGRPTLHIAPSYPYVADFVETLRRIRRLRSRLRTT